MSIDLDAIEARIAAATPGPWIHGDRWHIQDASQCPCRLDYGPLIHNGPMDINGEVMPSHVHEAPEPFWNHGIWQRPTAETEWAPEVVLIDEAATLLDADAELIAAAPTDLAALVAEVRALRADVFTLRADARMADDISRDRARERDEIERLRAVAEASAVLTGDPDDPAWRTLSAALDAWRAGGGA